MKAGASVTAALLAFLATLQGEPAAAQADSHARALARATCQSGKQSEAVTDAAAALDRDPNELGPRMRLADALVDQGCYQEAVEVLEVTQQAYPRNSELAGKLRDVRSLVTEQTYIEGLTQAAEGAKLQRNQLRCTRLADVTACDDALKFKPDDAQLLLAKADALMQANRPAEAVVAYRHASQLKPADDALKTKLTAAEALQASTAPPPAIASLAAANTAAARKPPKRPPGASTVANAGAPAGTAPGASADGPAAGIATAGATQGGSSTASAGATRGAGTATLSAANATRPRTAANAGTPLATVAALQPQEARTYSNDAPPGPTN